jgi:pimeloyl-ACP methyl ester carboxylesterase
MHLETSVNPVVNVEKAHTFSPKGVTSLIFHPFGKFILGPYYRSQLFPATRRSVTQGSIGLKKTLIPSEEDPRLHIIEYWAGRETKDVVMDRRLFVFIHGRNCSASSAGKPSRHSSTDVVNNLSQYGSVLGVNLPGYEESPLTDDSLENAERDTLEVTGHLESFVRRAAATRGIMETNVVIVGYSIGTYMSHCLASRLQIASVVLIAPPRDLKSINFSLRGISLKPLIPFAARHAYPRDLELTFSPGYKTTGFNSVRFLERYGDRIIGNMAIFVAENDEIVPGDAGQLLKRAFDNSVRRQHLARLYNLPGCRHNASPSKEAWQALLRDWDSRVLQRGSFGGHMRFTTADVYHC